MPQKYSKIIFPTRPQSDTCAATFLLKKFGEKQFPGISEAQTEIWQIIPEGETEGSLEKKGIVLIDLGGGRFDHHGKLQKTTATALVADFLGVQDDPALAKILEFTERDDFYGKGTISSDPLDRVFGLAGLITSLNRFYTDNPALIMEITRAIFSAHYEDEKKRTHELPAELKEKEQAGLVQNFIAKQRDKKLKVILIESDNLSMPGYLRSRNGGAFDVVVQILSSGHVNILTRPTKRVDLRQLARQIRIEEVAYGGKNLNLSEFDLKKTARIKQAPEWYFDPATNSIQNGGANPKEISATKIPKTEFPRILKIGLESYAIN